MSPVLKPFPSDMGRDKMNYAKWSRLKLLVFWANFYAGLKIKTFKASYGKEFCTAGLAWPQPCTVPQIWSLFLPLKDYRLAFLTEKWLSKRA